MGVNYTQNGHSHHHLSCEICQQYYSVRRLAEMWDLSQKTIKRMIQNDKLKAKRINGSVRIPHSEIVKAIGDV
jgi:hypothetical protein